MASFTDTVKLVFDAETSKATAGVKNMRDGVNEAEGVFGKLKAGASGAFDLIGNAGPLAAAGAATAVLAFGQKAVGAFQELALAAKNFATAAGTGVSDASRWLEVANDLGVSGDAVSAAMARLNREAAAGKLAEFGIDADNANDRLIETLEYIASIPNEADRARAQFELLGKGGAALTPLIGNVGELRDRLAEVQGGKIIDESDVADAEALRDSMDNLADAWDSIVLSVGKAVAPLVTKLADLIDKASSVAGGDTGGGVIGFFGKLVSYTPGIDAINGLLGDNEDATKKVDSASKDAAQSVGALAAQQDEQREASEAAAKALHTLYTATLASFNANLALADSADQTEQAIAEYTKANDAAAASGYGNADANKAAAKELNNAEQAALTQAAAAAKLAEQTAIASGAQFTDADAARVQADALRTVAGTLDPNSPLYKHLQGYIDQLDAIPATKNTDITADTSQAIRAINELIRRMGVALEMAPGVDLIATPTRSGTSATAPTSAVAPTGLALVPTAAPLAATGFVGGTRGLTAPSGAPVINMTVNAPPLTNPADVGRAVADALDAFYRRNGTRLRAVP